MKTIHGMILGTFILVFLVSVMFFVLVVQLLDLFTNLWRYLAHDTGLREILTVAYYYLPKCVSYAIPPGLLFSAAYTLGVLYKNNELIAILGSGISLIRLVLPFVLVGVLLSVFGFFFEQYFVIDTFIRKNELFRAAVRQEISYSNTNVTVISEDTRTIYQVDYYNDKKQTLTDVMILQRRRDNGFAARIDADWGEWNGEHWILHNSRRYSWDEVGQTVRLEQRVLYEATELSEPPPTFRKSTRDVEEMKSGEAWLWIDKLKRAGLPYRGALTEYYSKYFFAASPFIVVLIATGMGGRFKRNVLLMNLLTALVVSVVYYVLQMVTVILAKNGLLPPLAGAGLSFVLFLGVGTLALRTART
ncbi:MAG: LptF/LptG family permease [Spirochaetaceae bacterium]|nr:MAG: LptF/LptG family permease [Spirochaetaceae bacterium]